MLEMLRSRVTLVWLILVGATGLSWALGHGIGIADPRRAGAAILVIAFLKVRWVLLDFMELRGAPRALRLAAESWVVVACAVLVVLHLR
mgnify:CR=1 FL=1